jgi:sugar phosphate isomerase/epimerase
MTPTEPAPASLALGAMAFRDRPIQEVLQAVAMAGFSDIGMSVGQAVSALERGISLDALPGILHNAGVRVAELELVRLCENRPVQVLNTLVEELASALAPDRVHTAAWVGEPAQIIDDYAALCSRLPGTMVAIEFMPYSSIPSLEAATEIVCAADQPNASIVLDVLHFFRSGGTVSELHSESLKKVVAIQLSDAVKRHGVSLAHEARHLRTYPGEGTLDLGNFLRAIGRARHELPPISIEPMSDALQSISLSALSDKTMFTTLKVLNRAGFELDPWGRYVYRSGQ